jgi:hypothetical protein
MIDSLGACCCTVANLRAATWIEPGTGHINRLNKFAASSTERERSPSPESQACPKVP